MSLEFQAAAQRRMRRAIIGLVVVVALLAATVVLLALRPSPDSPDGTATRPSATRPASSGGGGTEPPITLTPDPSFVPPTQWVRLPKATSTRMGVPAGFEHSPEGAVAAAVSVAELGTTWDLAVADRVTQAYAAPADADRLRAALRQEVTGSRTALGLPETGPVPPTAHLSLAAIGVTWTAIDADRVQLFVLGRQTYTTGGAPEKTEIVRLPAMMVWIEGDWRNSIPRAFPTAPAPAELGTAAFNAAGWRAIQQGSAG